MTEISAITPEHFTTFGELLKFLRRRAGLSQRELSIAVGYSESQISRLEQNQRAPDAAAVAARFVSALDLETERAWAARLLELAAASRVAGESEQREHEAHTPSHNLPLQLTSFVGREREITELERLLSTSRLVTLTGAGGVGKTRLALQVAAELLDSFPDGVWLVDLAPLADPALVPQTVARVLGVREEVGRPLLDTLSDHLHARQALLVLDNCEHLIQASAQFSEAVLQACSKLRILATSREILGVAGEQSFYVPPLSTPDARALPPLDTLSGYEAVRLFLERAAAVMPDFALTGDNAAAIAQVCQRLDGIPLAIELAAARLRMLPVEQIAERLDDRFRLLTGGSRTALPRHQTLQALMDWSYELLPAAEQVLLRRLSVFAGGWTLETAEAVCAGDVVEAGSVVHLIGNLIDKSLVLVEEQAGAARYRMLETLRHYALAKLDAGGEGDAVRHRHAEYYLALAETASPSLYGAPPSAWFDRVAVEYDNLRAALTWSQSTAGGAELGLRMVGALRWFWYVRGSWSEARSWLEAALAHPQAAGYAHARAVVLLSLGDIFGMQGDYPSAQAQLTNSLRLFQELGETPWSAWVLNRLGGLAHQHQHAVATARRQLEESIALYREIGDKENLGWVLVTLGEVAVMQEDVAGASILLEEGLALVREMKITFATGWALNHLGHVAQLQGEYGRATRLHEQSLAYFREYGNLGNAWAFEGLGETAVAEGKAGLATKHLTEALELFRDLGERAGVAWCLAGLAGAAALSEEPERAACLWGAAEALRQSIGARPAPAARATRERLMADVRAQLGEAAFDAAWAAGQAASTEQAIAEALRSAE